MYAVRSACSEKFGGLSAQPYLWGTEFGQRDLDILPRKVSSPTGFESLKDSFFCSEPCGITLARGCTFTFAIGAFAFRKNFFTKTRRSRHRFAYAINFHNVDAC